MCQCKINIETIELSDSYFLKKLLGDQKGMFINQIREILENISIEEFISFSCNLIQNDDSSLLHSFNYYLVLFKDIPRIQELLAHESTPNLLLESLILWGFSTTNEKAKNPAVYIIDEVFFFFPPQKIRNLLLNSSVISRDTYLSYYLLTKLKGDDLTIFFEQKKDLRSFIHKFHAIPKEEAKYIILRNPELFTYMIMHLHLFDSGDLADSFTRHFEADIVEMERIKKIAITSSLLEESSHKRGAINNTRIRFLIHELLKLKEKHNISHLLEKKELFLDKKEQILVREILFNPMYHDILRAFHPSVEN